MAGSGIYAAAKAAVHSLTRALAKGTGRRWHSRQPRLLPASSKRLFHDDTPYAALNAALNTIPLGRLGTAEDCAWSFVFLASPTMSGYITGQIIDINGGQLMP